MELEYNVHVVADPGEVSKQIAAGGGSGGGALVVIVGGDGEGGGGDGEEGGGGSGGEGHGTSRVDAALYPGHVDLHPYGEHVTAPL